MSNGRDIILAALWVVAFPMEVLGVIIYGFTDHFDSHASATVARMYPEVAEQARQLGGFLDAVVPRTLSAVERVLGRPAAFEPDSTYAMPLCQVRAVALGGLGQRLSHVHREFYPIEDVGGLQIWYHGDSTAVATSVVYLKVDSFFVPYNRGTQNDLGTRLAWDQHHITILEQAIRRLFGPAVPPNNVLQPPAPHDGQR